MNALMSNRRRQLLRNQRRVGETITIASGIGLALIGSFLGVPFVSYGGLCIAGLGVVSVFWRWWGGKIWNYLGALISACATTIELLVTQYFSTKFENIGLVLTLKAGQGNSFKYDCWVTRVTKLQKDERLLYRC